MENFFWTLVPIIIAGITFLNYKNPPFSRKIIIGLTYATVLIYGGATLYFRGENDAFALSKESANVHPFYNRYMHVNVDSIFIADLGFDTFNIMMKKDIKNFAVSMALTKNEEAMTYLIESKITAMEKEVEQKKDVLLYYCIGAEGVLLVLYLLSFYLYKVLDHKNLHSDKETDKTGT